MGNNIQEKHRIHHDWRGAKRGGKMATAREGRREHAGLPKVTSAKPTALGGGGGKNHSPPRIAPCGYGPGGPAELGAPPIRGNRPAPTPDRSRPDKKIPYGFTSPSPDRDIRGQGGQQKPRKLTNKATPMKLIALGTSLAEKRYTFRFSN